jgi:LacI family transcriptional regulator
MSPSKSTITIQDVAEAAGVSVSTVSRVLNSKVDVAPETYEKVQRVIQELNYASSLAAKSMRSRKTNVIGLFTHDLTHSFTTQVLKGVERGLSQSGYDLIIYTSSNKVVSNWAAWERHHVSLLSGSITDGIIVTTPTATTFSTLSPIVAIDPHNESADFPAVIATNRVGALELMTYLVKLGHRRIGFIGGRPDLKSATRRLQGYKDGLLQASISLDPALIQMGDYTQETAFVCARKLLNLPDRPTAIFAANDESAKGVMEAAQQIGLHVPDDLSVVGFDNIPEAAYLTPSLTTVDQSIETMGYLAVEMLIRLIEGKPLEQNLCKVPTKLIIRDSCRAL